MSELGVDFDLRTNPWTENMGGMSAQIRQWMDTPFSGPRARLLYATPIYEQTIAQLAPNPVVHEPYTTDDAWYDDDFWVGGAWYDEDDEPEPGYYDYWTGEH